QRAVELAEVVADDAAREPDAIGIAGRKIGADDVPGLAAVARPEEHLAAEVDRVVEPVDCQRRRPLAAVLQPDRVAVERVLPRAARSPQAGDLIKGRDVRGITGAPDEAMVVRLGIREARFARGHAFLRWFRRRVATAASAATRLRVAPLRVV